MKREFIINSSQHWFFFFLFSPCVVSVGSIASNTPSLNIKFILFGSSQKKMSRKVEYFVMMDRDSTMLHQHCSVTLETSSLAWWERPSNLFSFSISYLINIAQYFCDDCYPFKGNDGKFSPEIHHNKNPFRIRNRTVKDPFCDLNSVATWTIVKTIWKILRPTKIKNKIK